MKEDKMLKLVHEVWGLLLATYGPEILELYQPLFLELDKILVRGVKKK